MLKLFPLRLDIVYDTIIIGMRGIMMHPVEKHRDLVLVAEEYLRVHPETGFREEITCKYLAENFEKLGYTLTYAGDIPGFYTVIDTGRPGPEVLVLAEMDALLCPSHPDADPVTGAAHACGHHVQGAAILGLAAALKEPGTLDGLSGRIRLCCVPAEEYIETEYRMSLKEKGIIRYLGGKLEFLRRGYFDGVDMAFMLHAGWGLSAAAGAVGFTGLQIEYKGLAAHASDPWNGINALSAANCGMNAINAIRDNFREEDLVRVQTIITNGGDATNTIPASVTLQCRIRGKTDEAMASTRLRVKRALIGGAVSLGAGIEITDFPGYAPLYNDPGLLRAAKTAADELGMSFYQNLGYGTGSTDMGDLSAVMPAIHPFGGGCTGGAHAPDFKVADKEEACVGGAKWEFTLLNVLLRHDAVCAREIVENYTPRFSSKAGFLAHLDSMDRCRACISYENGTAIAKLD